jgi:dCMP deaminase
VREREQIEVEAFHGRLQLVQTNTLDPVRWARPLKYQFVEHAERNAIFNAARIGVKTEGCWAFMNFMPTPCADCARALIQAGIVKIIGSDRPFPGVGAGVHYHIDETSKQMLKEGGVETLTVPTR